MIELTPEQRQEMSEVEPTIMDPETREAYVRVRKDAYDRMKAIISSDEEWAASAYNVAMEVFARDGWDDPRMDLYDKLAE